MKHFFYLIFFCLTALTTRAQHVAIKTNLLYDATATVNLGLEVGLGQKFSLDVSGDYNDWPAYNGMQWKHWLVQPELRYWKCDRFNGHFFGLHALGGEYDVYNVKLPFGLYPGAADGDYRGSFVGGGLSYGYQWLIGQRWNLEATIGVGYMYTKYDRYADPDSDVKQRSGSKNYIGPTKVGISIMFLIF